MNRFLLAFVLLLIQQCASAQDVKSVDTTTDAEFSTGLKIRTSLHAHQTNEVNTRLDRGSVKSGGVNNHNEEQTILYNYNELSNDVKAQIDLNKSQGLPTLNGIVKSYDVVIKSCIIAAECQANLSFLNNEAGYIRTILIGEGLVTMIVSKDLSSERLKEILVHAGLEFNFINEKLVLNQK